ncbi:MAG: cytochrome c [Gammaproteobacteria bacterium]|nr:cytochrome c [Gammaproteobacteria bacterium]
MTRLFTYIYLSSFVFISAPINANVENGKELHNSNCTSCHISIQGGDGSGIYTRENKRIESHPALIKQVKRCRDSLGVPWPDEHVGDVVEYLNNTFYKFK